MDGPQPDKGGDIFAGTDTTRVPFRVYEDQDIYKAELERIFYGPTWNYVGLECEVPKEGDFRRNFIGEREILMIRKNAWKYLAPREFYHVWRIIRIID